MNRSITLTQREADLLEDVLGYLVSEDDRERDDFVTQIKENTDLTEDELFTEEGVLLCEKVPKVHQNHIFYKASVLLSELAGASYGG